MRAVCHGCQTVPRLRHRHPSQGSLSYLTSLAPSYTYCPYETSHFYLTRGAFWALYPLSGLHHGVKAQATSSASSTQSAPTTECHHSNSSCYIQRYHSPASIVLANSNIKQVSTTLSKPGGSKAPIGQVQVLGEIEETQIVSSKRCNMYAV